MYITEHFEEIVGSEDDDFGDRSFEEFYALLSNDDIFCKGEGVVVKGLFKWLEANEPKDIDTGHEPLVVFIKRLIDSVRLPFVF